MDALDLLWEQLARAERSGAPPECAGLLQVPFDIQRAWYGLEFRQRVVQWYRPRPGDVIEPFADLTQLLDDLPRARIRDHHLACCAIEVPGAPNSALLIGYALGDRRHWVGLPGVTYRAAAATFKNSF